MPKSEIATIRRQLNAYAGKYPDDPYLKERVGQIRENLTLLQRGGDKGLFALAAMNVAELAEYVKTKRAPR